MSRSTFSFACVVLGGALAAFASGAWSVPPGFLPHGVCYNWNASLRRRASRLDRGFALLLLLRNARGGSDAAASVASSPGDCPSAALGSSALLIGSTPAAGRTGAIMRRSVVSVSNSSGWIVASHAARRADRACIPTATTAAQPAAIANIAMSTFRRSMTTPRVYHPPGARNNILHHRPGPIPGVRTDRTPPESRLHLGGS